jgi:hypothetical protein
MLDPPSSIAIAISSPEQNYFAGFEIRYTDENIFDDSY